MMKGGNEFCWKSEQPSPRVALPIGGRWKCNHVDRRRFTCPRPLSVTALEQLYLHLPGR